MITRIKQAIYRHRSKKVKGFLSEYIKANNLSHIIDLTDQNSESVGNDMVNYVLLHSYIVAKKPRFVLELGTGKSSWIIAEAMLTYSSEMATKPKMISMEQSEYFCNQAKSILPDKYKDIVEFHYSPVTTYHYSFLFGTCHTEIPSYPYELVYVDGPHTYINDFENGVDKFNIPIHVKGKSHVVANMDFIKLLQTLENPCTGIIDFRTRTQIAYGCIFGKHRVKMMRHWGNKAIVENVTKDNMIINNDYKQYEPVLRSTVTYDYSNPSWISL